ncbi:MAG: DUF2752 domain-containing protein [Clostridia bacterium]|nr:DUF2752 domain-containing protein [Clostridia bacterium]
MVKKIRKEYIFILFLGIALFIGILNRKIAIGCIIYEITGFYCPGCGITRAILSLVKGDIYQAFRYNQILFIDIPIIIITSIIYLKFKNNKIVKITVNIIFIMLFVITLIFGVMRNIPKFSYLAPTII